jgi:hypothetical protein
MYASSSVSEVLADLDRGILALESDSKPDCRKLTLLFAPTGNLQEMSMANEWAQEYLALSARFDDLIA